MSIWAVNWALNEELPSPTSKLLLVALANFANDEDEAWPHLETLERVVGVSKRSVLRGLRELCEGGWVIRLRGFAEGPRGGTVRVNSVYRLLLPETVTRRYGRGSERPGQLREMPSQLHSDTGVTMEEAESEAPSQFHSDGGVTMDHRGDTGDTTVVTLVSPPYKEEPSVEPTQAPLPPILPVATSSGRGSGGLAGLGGAGVEVPDEGSGLVAGPGPERAPAGPSPTASSRSGFGSGSGVDSGPGGGSPPAVSSEEWTLVRRCLPEAMQALDGPGVGLVAPLLRERIGAGWRPEALREVLAADPLPDQVRHLAGLVVHRLGRIPAGAAPPSRSSSLRRSPDPPSSPLSPEDRDPVAVRAEAARMEAIRTGSPDAERSRSWWLRRAMGEGSGESQGAADRSGALGHAQERES